MKKKVLIPVILVIIAAVVCLLVYFINKPKELNANDYIEVKFDGYDSMGKATVSFDEEEFLYDVSQNAKIDKMIQKNLAENGIEDASEEELFHSGMLAALDFSSKISYELDKETDLSNGDTVTIKWTIDTDYLKEHYGIKLLSAPKQVKVKNLKEAVTFNPFDDLTIKFTGANGQGTVKLIVNSDDEIYEAFSFRADKASELSNGDKINIVYGGNFGDDLQSYSAENFGMIPDPTSIEVKVEGLK
ncbi:MAG: hypothetical protein K5769_00340 [Pseudobutyrivibrio sp.]|nr:hypothetical protein [Pseudobutyrivibrio sp.]